MIFSADDYCYMARAIQLARRGIYSTSPNPRVGCVLVKDGAVIAEGWHIRSGEGHAEVNAIANCRVSTEGATAYVSLEPCSHQGKTPPCAEALINAKVGRVVAAMQDPNPLVSGKGFERLRGAGIEVNHGLMASEAADLNPGFIRRCQGGKPYVRVKLACSVDGRIAMASGESQWITGPAARQDVQKLRARSGAIVTGAETVRCDDPSLTVRVADCDKETQQCLKDFQQQPLRVVVSGTGHVPAGAKIFGVEGDACLLTPEGAEVDPALSRQHVPMNECSADKLDPSAILNFLDERNVNEVLVESGGQLAGQFVEAGLCDELWIYIAPVIMGSSARASLGIAIEQMMNKLPLRLLDVRKVGDDIRMIYSPRS